MIITDSNPSEPPLFICVVFACPSLICCFPRSSQFKYCMGLTVVLFFGGSFKFAIIKNLLFYSFFVSQQILLRNLRPLQKLQFYLIFGSCQSVLQMTLGDVGIMVLMWVNRECAEHIHERVSKLNGFDNITITAYLKCGYYPQYKLKERLSLWM